MHTYFTCTCLDQVGTRSGSYNFVIMNYENKLNTG